MVFSRALVELIFTMDLVISRLDLSNLVWTFMDLYLVVYPADPGVTWLVSIYTERVRHIILVANMGSME